MRRSDHKSVSFSQTREITENFAEKYPGLLKDKIGKTICDKCRKAITEDFSDATEGVGKADSESFEEESVNDGLSVQKLQEISKILGISIDWKQYRRRKSYKSLMKSQIIQAVVDLFEAEDLDHYQDCSVLGKAIVSIVTCYKLWFSQVW